MQKFVQAALQKFNACKETKTYWCPHTRKKYTTKGIQHSPHTNQNTHHQY